MKRPTRKKRDRSVIIAEKRWRRRKRRLRLRRIKRPRRISKRCQGPDVELFAPRVFTVSQEEPRRQLVQFLIELSNFAVTKARKVVIDFRQTKHMVADGTVLFAAVLHKIIKESGKTVRCYPPRHDVVRQVLQHIGIFEMLRCPVRRAITAKNVKSWKVASGSGADGERAASVIDQYQSEFGNDAGNPLFSGLTEAMTNCVHHAYDHNATTKPWWVFSEVREGRLVVAICDLGVGIPTSLASKPDWSLAIFEFLKEKASGDGRAIQAAMEIGRSRTGQTNRGRGLNEIRKVLDASQGKLQIHSNRGSYLYDAKTGTETCHNFKKSAAISGTIVLWTVPYLKDNG